jgi:hypothetical protein
LVIRGQCAPEGRKPFPPQLGRAIEMGAGLRVSVEQAMARTCESSDRVGLDRRLARDKPCGVTINILLRGRVPGESPGRVKIMVRRA